MHFLLSILETDPLKSLSIVSKQFKVIKELFPMPVSLLARKDKTCKNCKSQKYIIKCKMSLKKFSFQRYYVLM